jgi:hypothetical protein
VVAGYAMTTGISELGAVRNDGVLNNSNTRTDLDTRSGHSTHVRSPPKVGHPVVLTELTPTTSEPVSSSSAAPKRSRAASKDELLPSDGATRPAMSLARACSTCLRATHLSRSFSATCTLAETSAQGARRYASLARPAQLQLPRRHAIIDRSKLHTTARILAGPSGDVVRKDKIDMGQFPPERIR